MRDIRNIVIGVLVIALAWGWADAQQRKPAAPPQDEPSQPKRGGNPVGTYTTFRGNISFVAGRGQGAMPDDENRTFRMNTSTGAIEEFHCMSDGGAAVVKWVPIAERR